ncbi:MAG: hypothetical protein R2774_10945 [Saprospiraceae bacterium]
MVFGLFVTSCGDNIADVSSPTRTESETHQKITAEIERFTNAMTTDIQLRSSMEYTAEEFTKNTEESINYTYALPFVKYNETETSNDTLLLTINNCKILESEGPSKYHAILNKIICAYTCSSINNKKLKFVKVSIIDKSCSHIKLSIVTSVGTTDVPATASVPNPPGPSNHASFRKEFTSSLWATSGYCSGTGPQISAPKQIGKYATHNIIGGDDLVHTLINTQHISLDDIYPVGIPNSLDWWRMLCQYDEDGCELSVPNNGVCGTYFNPDFTLNSVGQDFYCLTAAELNTYLTETEDYCIEVAQYFDKDFVNVEMWFNSLLCDGIIGEFWFGDLIIGDKIYRPSDPQLLPTITCNCI